MEEQNKMKKIKFIIIAIVTIIISCSSIRHSIDENEIRKIESNTIKINCIVHNYILEHERNHKINNKYRFRLIVKYLNLKNNNYELLFTEGADILNIETSSLISYLNENVLFTNTLLEMKKSRECFYVVNDTTYCMINIRNLDKQILP